VRSDGFVFLSSLRKMKRIEAEAIVRDAERKSNVIRIARALTEDEEMIIEPWKLLRRCQVCGHIPVQNEIGS
jgi:hypothetical protein